MSCCTAGCAGAEGVFDEPLARRDLDAYRSRGPSESTALLLEAIRRDGGKLESLLDIGGGVGAIAHELLANGLSRATLVDGSASYIAAAREESARRSTGDRLQLRQGDFVGMADGMRAADLVTIDKVVCCYPDMRGLLTASAGRARKLYGIVYPRDAWWVRLAIAAENRVRRFRGSEFRNYIHSNAAIDVVLRDAGFRPRYRSRGLWWVVALFERGAASEIEAADSLPSHSGARS